MEDKSEASESSQPKSDQEQVDDTGLQSIEDAKEFFIDEPMTDVPKDGNDSEILQQSNDEGIQED